MPFPDENCRIWKWTFRSADTGGLCKVPAKKKDLKGTVVGKPSKQSGKAVLFDKDGTLFSFTETWAHFCDRMLDALAGNDEALKDRLAETCGYLRAERRFVSGSLIVNASAAEVDAAWADLVAGVSLVDVEALTRRILTDLPHVPTCDLHAVLGSLRARGLLLGVATNDYEAGAVAQLEQAGALSLFDFVCGSDSGFGRKPEPGMIEGFCRQFDIDPAELVFVGDSKHDMDCAVAGGVGCRVAVLTGPATADDLAPHATVVLPSIADLPAWLFNDAEKDTP